MRIKLNTDTALPAIVAIVVWLIFAVAILYEGRRYNRTDDRNPFIKSCLDRGKARDICTAEWRYLFAPLPPENQQNQ